MLLDRGLRSRGHATLLVHGAVGSGEATLERPAAAHNLRTIKLPELGPRISALSDVRAFVELTRIVFRERPDVVHTHTAKAGALGRIAAAIFNTTRRRSRRALVVHTFHGHVLTGYFGPLGNTIVRLAERALATITDSIVTISPAQQRDIVERFSIAPAARVATIPLGLDLDSLLALPSRALPLRRELGIGSADLVVGYVGRFVRIKALETLITAFAEVLRNRPDAWLLMAGDGPVRGEIEYAARVTGTAARVCFLGWTERLVELYGAMDICALSSLNEGTPVMLLEAMAAGKPVVATAVGGVPDIVEHQRTGLLVEPRDAGGLAAAILELARDADKRARIGMAARQEVGSRFSHVRLVDDIERLYERGLKTKRGTIPDLPCR